MKIICNLPNASELINGVAFKKRGDVVVSEEVTQEVADSFTAIPGYEVLPDTKDAKKPAEKAPAA